MPASTSCAAPLQPPQQQQLLPFLYAASRSLGPWPEGPSVGLPAPPPATLPQRREGLPASPPPCLPASPPPRRGPPRLPPPPVQAILSRRNTFTGRLYSEEPCILGWDLANEPINNGDDSGDVLQAQGGQGAGWLCTGCCPGMRPACPASPAACLPACLARCHARCLPQALPACLPACTRVICPRQPGLL